MTKLIETNTYKVPCKVLCVRENKVLLFFLISFTNSSMTI